MKVVFRADASTAMGTGHIMRCLTLANTLHKAGVECHFVCRDHPGNLGHLIAEQGHYVHFLAVRHVSPLGFKSTYASWLGATESDDASEFLDISERISPDWVVVDHYGIGHLWESAIYFLDVRLLVIDDLADRKHNCDVLLDQNFGRKPQDYQPLVPRRARLVLGTQYALLRREFYTSRPISLARRKHPVFKVVLISLGGIDAGDSASKVLADMEHIDFSDDMKILIVVGTQSPHVKNVRAVAERSRFKVEVIVGPSNMAELMCQADIAIGAAGATSWERCCLGIPTILFSIARNQDLIAQNLKEAGAAIVIKNPGDLKALKDAFQLIQIRKNYKCLSSNSAELVDGCGVDRIASIICSGE